MKKNESCKTIKSPLALGFILLFSFISFFGFTNHQYQAFTYKPTTESLYKLREISKKTFCLSKNNFYANPFSVFHALKSTRELVIVRDFKNFVKVKFAAENKDPIEITFHNKLLKILLKSSTGDTFNI